jgi:DNA-directed RNA polymerase specialized sigma24 family protein
MEATRQDDEEGLVKFLVEDQYEQVFRLCLIVCGDPIPARQAAQQTIATAAGKAYQFTGRTSAQAWLYRLALETCRNLHSPPVHKAFLARYLQQDMDLSIDEIAYVLKVPQSRVRVELERTGLEGPDSGGANQEARDTFSLPALSPLDERLIRKKSCG